MSIYGSNYLIRILSKAELSAEMNQTVLGEADDEWQKGSYNRSALWAFYSISNYIGAALCFVAIYGLTKILNGYPAKQRHAVQVAYIGLLLGCLLMSVPCATQCFLNLVRQRNRFEYGMTACKFEAYFHVIAIIDQFWSNLSIAVIPLVSAYRISKGVIREGQTRVRISHAIAGVLLIWGMSILGTLVAAFWSRVELQETGAYCFPAFDSWIIRGWFSPSMIIALILQATAYIWIYRLTKVITLPTLSPTQDPATRIREREKAIHHLKTLIRSAVISVLIFFTGWFMAVIAFFYALDPNNHNRITQALDIALAVPGSLHSIAVPLWIIWTLPTLRKWAIETFCCQAVARSFTLAAIASAAAAKPRNRPSPSPRQDLPSIRESNENPHSEAVVVMSLPLANCTEKIAPPKSSASSQLESPHSPSQLHSPSSLSSPEGESARSAKRSKRQRKQRYRSDAPPPPSEQFLQPPRVAFMSPSSLMMVSSNHERSVALTTPPVSHPSFEASSIANVSSVQISATVSNEPTVHHPSSPALRPVPPLVFPAKGTSFAFD